MRHALFRSQKSPSPSSACTLPESLHSYICISHTLTHCVTCVQVEAIVNDFVQVEHLANIIDTLGGNLTSGTVDGALLQFEDVDGDGGFTRLKSCVCIHVVLLN